MVGFVFIFNSLYISRHLPVVLKALENSRYVATYLRLTQGLGLFGRIFLINKIACMVIWPGFEIRLGLLNANDIANFPPRILRLLKFNIGILAGATIWGAVAYIVLESR